MIRVSWVLLWLNTKVGQWRLNTTPTIPVEGITEWVMPAIEPDDNVYFIGPESPGWRWYYARRATLASRSTTMASGEDMKV